MDYQSTLTETYPHSIVKYKRGIDVGACARWRMVDLSLPLAESLPTTWPGDVRFQMRVTTWFREVDELGIAIPSRGPFQTHTVHMSDHIGTHCDAPAHFIPDAGWAVDGRSGSAPTVERLDLTFFFGPAAVIDVDQVSPDPGGCIQPQDVDRYELRYGPIRPGSVVLFRSGWDERYRAGGGYYGPLDDPAGEAWPVPSVDTIEALSARGVRCLGTDAPSIGSLSDPVAAHVAALGRGLAVVEGLARLNQVPAQGAYFLFLPVKLVGACGGPGRAVAWVPEFASG
jgi:kynurenine formamidase